MNRLNAHLAEVDVYRMNRELLYRYLQFVLADERIAIMQLKADLITRQSFAAAFMHPVALLPHYFAIDVLRRLREVAGDMPETLQAITARLRQLERRARWQKWFPWLTLLVVFLLCLAMYLFARK